MEKDEYDLFLYNKTCAFGTIGVVIVICNLFSLFVLYRIHDMHDVTKLLMMALTTTDIGVGLFGISYAFQPSSVFILVAVNFFQLLDLNILVIITIVRYIAVARPLRLETLVTKRRAYISLIIAFLICLTLCSFTFLATQTYILIAVSLLFVYPLIPMLIVFILYIKLLFIARHQARRIAAAEINAANAQAQLRRSNFKSLNTFMIIIGTTVVTWLPYSVLTNGSIYGGINVSYELALVVDILHLSNFWLYTLIYCWRNKGFRKVAKRMICGNARVIPDVLV